MATRREPVSSVYCVSVLMFIKAHECVGNVSRRCKRGAGLQCSNCKGVVDTDAMGQG